MIAEQIDRVMEAARFNDVQVIQRLLAKMTESELALLGLMCKTVDREIGKEFDQRRYGS